MAQAKAEVQAEFAEALQRAGLRPRGAPIMDGKKHRVPVEGDRRGRLSGTYIGHLDEFPAGYIHNFKTGEEIRWKAVREYPVLAPAERERMRARVAAEQTARRRREMAVSRIALAVWNRARPVHAHPYLTRKDVEAHGLRQDRKGNLLVPMRDADGRLWGLQTIDAEGKKLFMRAGRKQGLYAVLGAPEPGEPVVIAEGYATAATLREVTGLATIAAFDSGNLLDVARAARERDPARRIVIAADNDHHLPRLAVPLPNAGMEKATAAAEAVDGLVLAPRFTPADTGTDWNDYAAQHGKEAMRAIAQAELRPYGIELPPLQDAAPIEQATVTQADRDAARQRLQVGPRTVSRQAAPKTRHASPRAHDPRDRRHERVPSPVELRRLRVFSSASCSWRALPSPCPLPRPGGVRGGPLAESSAERSLWVRRGCDGRHGAMRGAVRILRPLASTQWSACQARVSDGADGRMVGRERILHPPGSLTHDRRGSPRPLEGDACGGRLR